MHDQTDYLSQPRRHRQDLCILTKKLVVLLQSLDHKKERRCGKPGPECEILIYQPYCKLDSAHSTETKDTPRCAKQYCCAKDTAICTLATSWVVHISFLHLHLHLQAVSRGLLRNIVSGIRTVSVPRPT